MAAKYSICGVVYTSVSLAWVNRQMHMGNNDSWHGIYVGCFLSLFGGEVLVGSVGDTSGVK